MSDVGANVFAEWRVVTEYLLSSGAFCYGGCVDG